MIQMGSILKVVDNSGAKTAFCINSLYHSDLKNYKFNLQQKVSIRSYYSSNLSLLKKNISSIKYVFQFSLIRKSLFTAIIVRQKKNLIRFNGSCVKFSNNSVILLDPKKENTPLGTRIFGVVNKELRLNKHLKIVSLASCII